MFHWILGGIIGVTITAIILSQEEEREKAEIAKEDLEAELGATRAK